MLSDAEIMAEFEAAEAILRGHFVLSSGLHSDTYLQCARVLMNPVRADKLCAALADKVCAVLDSRLRGNDVGGGVEPVSVETAAEYENAVSKPREPSAREAARSTRQDAEVRSIQESIDVVVAPAMGGVVVGYEMGRQLGLETMFCERQDGVFALRRGFRITPGARVLMVEDVVTTGKSSLEAVKCVQEAGGVVVAEASLVDRSGGNHRLPFPLISLLTLDVKTYGDGEVPAELAAIEVTKPGSRWLKG